MYKLIKKSNKSVVFKIIFLLLITNIFFVFAKSELIEHNHCEEENCPICETIYIVKENLKNISTNGKPQNIYEPFIAHIWINKIHYNWLLPEYTLVEDKVRLDC